jgi:hypothetical protein
VSVPCEWSWALRLSAAPVVAPYWELKTALMKILFWRNNIEDGNSVALCSSGVRVSAGLSLISYVKLIEKYLAFEPRSRSKSQLYSQSNFPTLRHENRKILRENDILKAKEPAPNVSIE